jgi:aldose 1-epimerase
VDHNFVFQDLFSSPGECFATVASEDKPIQLRAIAVLADPHTQTSMEIYSNQPGLQVYTGNFIDGNSPVWLGKKRPNGEPTQYLKHGGVCLETQNLPDAINHQPHFPDPILLPGVEYKHITAHRFKF